MSEYALRLEKLGEYQVLALRDALGGISTEELFIKALSLLKFVVEERNKGEILLLENPINGSRREIWFKEK